MQCWDILPWGVDPRHALQLWLLLPRGVQEHDTLPCRVSLRVVRPIKPQRVRSWKLLSLPCVERGGLCAGKLLSSGLLEPELVQRRLLLPQRISAAAVRGGLRVHEWVCQSDYVRGWDLLCWGQCERNFVYRGLLLPSWVQEHDPLPSGVPVRVIWPVQPNSMRCGELLCGRCVGCGTLRVGQLLRAWLVQSELVHGRLLLP